MMTLLNLKIEHKALLANTGGLFVMETEGQGDLLATAFGDLVELEVTPNKPLTIDNEHVVAWDRNLHSLADGISTYLPDKSSY